MKDNTGRNYLMVLFKMYEKIFQHILLSSRTRYSGSVTNLQFTKQGPCMDDHAKNFEAM